MMENHGLLRMGLVAPPSDVSLWEVVVSRRISAFAERLGAAIHSQDNDQRGIIDEVILLGHDLAAEGGLISMVSAYEAAEQLHPDNYDLGMLAIAEAWQGIAGWTLQREAA